MFILVEHIGMKVFEDRFENQVKAWWVWVGVIVVSWIYIAFPDYRMEPSREPVPDLEKFPLSLVLKVWFHLSQSNFVHLSNHLLLDPMTCRFRNGIPGQMSSVSHSPKNPSPDCNLKTFQPMQITAGQTTAILLPIALQKRRVSVRLLSQKTLSKMWVSGRFSSENKLTCSDGLSLAIYNYYKKRGAIRHPFSIIIYK